MGAAARGREGIAMRETVSGRGALTSRLPVAAARGALALLALLGVLHAAPVRALASAPAPGDDEGRLPPGLLAGLDDSHLLRATMLSREIHEGRLARADLDTIWLVPEARREAGEEVAMAAAAVPLAVGDIVRLEQRRSASDRGAEVGVGSGATVGGFVGLLFGMWAASWSDNGKDVPIVVASTLTGAAAIGALGSMVGAGLGATASRWYVLWPNDRAERARQAELAQARADSIAAAREPVMTRIVVEAGYAATGGPYDMTGAAFGLGLLGEPGPGLELGPMMRFHALDGFSDIPPTSVSGEQTRLEPIMSLSLDARLARAGAGWRPWAQGGLGLSLASDLYPSAHLGLGVRNRDARGREWGFVAGRHFMLGDRPDAAHGQWAATISFGIAP